MSVTVGQARREDVMDSISRKGGALAALLVLAVTAGVAQAAPGRHGGFHGGHGHFHGRSHVGVWVGYPWWYGYPYPYGRTVVVQAPPVVPPVYIEQGGEPTAQMWY
ncbi:hypothetical protein [Janthinobacterium sp. PAMC25594]|uniref:hypothetical protein n=1 Tax=Janthinobacterium sp. PAMC25594 TaxID=2861284 RepID=UPI002158FC0B|nr:hypothetical protein [Janthinobacterium sp. PAMC25594]